MQLRQQNTELQQCTMQLVRQLEREARCAVCQASRSATNGAGAGDGAGAGSPGAPSRPDGGASDAEVLERAAARSRVASLLSSLRGSESPVTLDDRVGGGGDGGDGKPSVRAAGEPSPLAGAVVDKRPETEAPADDPEGPGGTSGAEELPQKKNPPELDAQTATRAVEGDAAGANGVKRKFPEPETEQNEKNADCALGIESC